LYWDIPGYPDLPSLSFFQMRLPGRPDTPSESQPVTALQKSIDSENVA